MPTQRIIKSTFIGLNGEPLRNAVVQVIHMKGNTIDNIEYPQVTKNFITNREGKINFILWCNEEGERSSFYRFVLPGGETFDAIVPVGTSDLELSVLREGGADSSDPQHQSLITYILNEIGGALTPATSTVGGIVKTNSTSTNPVVYLKSEVDSLIAGVSGNDLTNYYTKPQNDTLLNAKADKSATYTKAQTDALIGGVTVDLSGYYTKTQTDGLVTPKANSVDVYTKVQTDTLISGATTTGSNVGVGGVGVYKQKTGSNLEFKNINAGSSKIIVTNDATNNEIDVDVVEANLTLNNLSGTLSVAKGGTGSTSASAALTALGAASTTSLTTHTSDTSNPHTTTAAQVGAIPTIDKGIALGVATLDSAGKIPDTQIPDAITRDTELTTGLATKADASTTYTKTQTDTLLTAKANQSTTYTKTEVDTLDVANVKLTGNQNIAGIKTFTDSTASTSTTTGGAIFNGGVGIGGDVFVGGSTRLSADKLLTLESTNTNPLLTFVRASTAISVRMPSARFTIVDSANSGGLQLSFGTTTADVIAGQDSTATSATFRAVDMTTGTNTAGNNLTLRCGKGTGTGTLSYIDFTTGVSGVSGSTQQTVSSKMRLTGVGNLLIGSTTDNATDKLQVNGSVSTTGKINITDSTSGNASYAGALTLSGIGIGNGNIYTSGIIVSANISATTAIIAPAHKGVDGSGTNNQAPSLTIRPGLSTGNAASAPIIFATGDIGTSGTTLQSTTEKMRITGVGNLLINSTTDNATDKLQVSGSTIATQYKLSALNTAPVSATATGTLGEIRWANGFVYLCVATNTWQRAALTTW